MSVVASLTALDCLLQLLLWHFIHVVLPWLCARSTPYYISLFSGPFVRGSVSPFAHCSCGPFVPSSVTSGRTYPLLFGHSALQLTYIPNAAISGRLLFARAVRCSFGPFGRPVKLQAVTKSPFLVRGRGFAPLQPIFAPRSAYLFGFYNCN